MIERALDYRRVKRLVDWPPIISSEFYYLIHNEDKVDLGLWSFQPYKKGFQIHADLGLKCRGRKAIESAKAAFKWIFENTVAQYIYAKISRENLGACYVASWSGMESLSVKDNIKHFKIMR